MSFTIKSKTDRRATFDVPRTANGKDGDSYSVLDADDVRLVLESMNSADVMRIWNEARAEMTRTELVTEEILEDITAANRGKPREVVSRRQVPTEIVDENQLHLRVGLRLFQAAVVDWEGIIGPDDKPFECSAENKAVLVEIAPGLARWVAELVVDLARFEEERDQKEIESDARFRNGSSRTRSEIPEVADGLSALRGNEAGVL